MRSNTRSKVTVLALVLVWIGRTAPAGAQLEVFSDGFELGNTSAWSATFSSGYGDCGNQQVCTTGEICITDGVPTVSVCSDQACTSAADCPAPPSTGDAPVTCDDVTGDMVDDCWLSCLAGETCPDGMSCFGGFICTWPVAPSPPAGYGDCANQPEAEVCMTGEICITDGVPTVAVCSDQACTSAADCPAAPSTGDAPVTCDDVTGDMVDDCWLSCLADETCPDGMTCFSGFICIWPVTGSAVGDPAGLGPGRSGPLLPRSCGTLSDAPWSW